MVLFSLQIIYLLELSGAKKSILQMPLILEEIMHKDVKITGKNGFVLLDIC